MKSVIISAFPGTGKSYLTNMESKPAIFDGWIFHDSDSSKFSWIYDAEGNKTDKRNPDFPANYMEHIKALMEEENNIIFVSSHEQVRNALLEAGFNFFIVRPDFGLKDKYLNNYRERGNDEKFIQLVDDCWITWLASIDRFQADHQDQVTSIIVHEDVYMDEVVEYLINLRFPVSWKLHCRRDGSFREDRSLSSVSYIKV